MNNKMVDVLSREEFELKLPKSLKKQQTIANILSDMDNEITTLNQKLSKYKQIKEGMMQQLLTGKMYNQVAYATRLKINTDF